jgi:hypothetical protein
MADASLTEHNRRVIAWKDAQDFSGIRADKAAALRNTMLLVGLSASKETGVCTRTVRWLAASSETRGHGVRPVTRGRLWEHIATLEKLGILSAERVKNEFTDKSRGLGAVNSYTCEFSQVTVQSGDRSGDRSGVVSTVTKRTTEDQKIDSGFASEHGEPEQKPAGRGRVPFSYPAYKPRAAAEKTPSNDARLTGSAAMDLITARFSDPVEREMCSEFIKMLRDYDCALVVKAAGFFFRENGRALLRVDKPRAYAHKCAGAVRETLDGWRQQEESRRRWRENVARDAQREAEADARRRAEEAGHEAAGEVKIDPFADGWTPGAPEWLPRDQAVQVPGLLGELVWAPKPGRRPDTDFSPGIGDLLDESPGRYQEGDEGEPGAGRR